ncbi:MAG: hypothetical protein ACLFVG_04745 [Candidatus Aminicenantes bacterium]
MEVLSFIILILLSLFAYSAGAVSPAGRLQDLKPHILDLLLVLMIWAGAICSRVILDLNKWLLILIWIIIGFLTGSSITLLRKARFPPVSKRERKERIRQNPVKKFWQNWKNFSKRAGSFQSKTFLSLFFFLVVTPFALAVKIFSDPLRLKPEAKNSYWLTKKHIPTDLEHFRRQF